MIHYEYDDGWYFLLDETRQCLWSVNEGIAVGFSYDPEDKPIPGTLHKHGSPKAVNQWAALQRKLLSAAGLQDMAKAIIVVSGEIPVEELNKIISISGYVGIWYKRMQEEQHGENKGEDSVNQEVAELSPELSSM